jgi:hypothetical protein
MGLVQDLMAVDRYETESLPELVSRVEKKNISDLEYINKKYSKEYKSYNEVPADILESEGEETSSLVEMSHIFRQYPEEYERYAKGGKYFNENDPYSPYDDEEKGGVPKEILKIMSEPDNYEAFK